MRSAPDRGVVARGLDATREVGLGLGSIERSSTVIREFHVSRDARDRYRFDETLFALSGNVVFANFHAARVFAARMNDRRDLVRFPEQSVSASQINAMGLIDEMLHLMVARYRKEHPGVIERAMNQLEAELGEPSLQTVLKTFGDEFPPVPVYRRELELETYLEGETGGVRHREAALEEALMLWLANANPAFARFQELFDDNRLRKRTEYLEAIDRLRDHLAGAPAAGPGGESLFDMLRAPALASPHSLEGQLDYIRQRWGELLGPEVYRLLSSLDFMAEEQKVVYDLGPGPVEPPDYSALDPEYEAYSQDRDWMPRLVLLAKNVHVWLAQLSDRYGRRIDRLDQIPDGELDTLAGWGITGLWLIGVWQRSSASERIKRMMGDDEAVASAYSLYDYVVAENLGGEAAFDDLKQRAGDRGIRMSTDMVPNHVGIDGRWVIEHPDWFIGLDHSPFPGYSFSGQDLCDDERVGIYLEDHYWDRSDAAVVFRRRDHFTGSERFIYHGNDGTSMPWNDTAQLDYRNPELREAVIQTILHVARRSPVIRFDAAMTLAKRHYHRLWFPEPGSGGDIPSRAEHGMTRPQLDEVMPEEFWREVVDRVAAEAPDTLLLAEAFWLLEGYFVRTLGMHRVYNSAFMNMLRDERNADYRKLITSTLEFDPQILKRYVNFMSNPDERTAVDQFGKDGKYFGVAALMATMPGLPMFGHGQIEGYTEKYGMEFRRPRWQEEPDQNLVVRHEKELFPILRRRHLFAEVKRFQLYDFFVADGSVDENVFAYSNASGDERALVLYHNCFGDTRGWIRTSTPIASKAGDGSKVMEQRTLAQGLSIPDVDDLFLVFRDATRNLEYIRPCSELVGKGLYAELGAYHLHVFVDFHEVQDDATHRYAQLATTLGGRGVPSIDEAMAELVLAPVLGPYRRLVGGALLEALSDDDGDEKSFTEVLGRAESDVRDLVAAVAEEIGASGETAGVVEHVMATLEVLPLLETAESGGAEEGPATRGSSSSGSAEVAMLAWAVTHDLGALSDPEEASDIGRTWLDEWMLSAVIRRTIDGLGESEAVARRAVTAVKLMTAMGGWHSEPDAGRVLRRLLSDRELQGFLGVNRHQGVLWFNRECYQEALTWMRRLATAEILRDHADQAAERQVATRALLVVLEEAEAASGYRVERLLEAVEEPFS